MSAVTLASIQAKQAELDGMIQRLLEQAETMTLRLHATEITLRAGERYAGITLDDLGAVKHHVILLPERPSERLNWSAAKLWAEGQGGVLPTRQEQSLLFANCRSLIEPDWYWSDQAEGENYAWYCHFGHGVQFYGRQVYGSAAVAVRRVNP